MNGKAKIARETALVRIIAVILLQAGINIWIIIIKVIQILRNSSKIVIIIHFWRFTPCDFIYNVNKLLCIC